MNKNAMFMEEAIRIFEETDFAKLHQSLNGGDEAYGNEVLEKLKAAHLRLFGEHPVAEEADVQVPFPAKITENEKGTVFLGISACHVIPLKEDNFLFKLLHGHLIQFASVMLPREYQTVRCCSADLLCEGEVTVTVYSGDRVIDYRITGEFAEKDETEDMEAADQEPLCLSQ